MLYFLVTVSFYSAGRKKCYQCKTQICNFHLLTDRNQEIPIISNIALLLVKACFTFGLLIPSTSYPDYWSSSKAYATCTMICDDNSQWSTRITEFMRMLNTIDSSIVQCIRKLLVHLVIRNTQHTGGARVSLPVGSARKTFCAYAHILLQTYRNKKRGIQATRDQSPNPFIGFGQLAHLPIVSTVHFLPVLWHYCFARFVDQNQVGERTGRDR